MSKAIRVMVALCAVMSCLADDVFLKIEGIPGDVTADAFKGQIQVFALSHEVVSPRDAASGQATGKRQHSPIRLVCELDRSMPLLMQALTMNKTIPTVEISILRRVASPAGGNGEMQLYFKYKLTNVGISSVRPWMPNTKDQSTVTYGTQVEVAFAYQKIEWTFVNGGVTHEDSWDTQTR